MKYLLHFLNGYSISLTSNTINFSTSKLIITYEYTGIVEMISLGSLLCFFPIHSPWKNYNWSL